MDSQQNIVVLSHEWVRARLKLGARAIDATAGNGNDTLFLAQCVGDNGRVAAFDIQESAIEATRHRLAEAGCHNVKTFLLSHEKMADALGAEWCGATQAILFNLGYLPRSDHATTTLATTTIRALAAAATMLAPGGILSIAVYTKHPGGFEESAAVEKWLAHCGAKKILRHGHHNPATPWLAAAIF